jgi:nitroreductase
MSKNAYETLLTCRSIRHFIDTPIPDEALERILEAGRWTGSAKNVQPWQFGVVREKETLQRLADCGKYASHLKGAAAAIVIVTPAGAWADFDAGRVAQNMMLAAWTEGIGSCIASLHHEAQAREVLGIPEDLQARIAISLGYPLEGAPQTIEGRPRKEILTSVGRQSLDKLVHWEKW